MVYCSRDSQMLSKLDPSWIGPATVMKKNGLEYSVKLPNGKIVNRLHPKYLNPYPKKNLEGGSVVISDGTRINEDSSRDTTTVPTKDLTFDPMDEFTVPTTHVPRKRGRPRKAI